MTGESEQHPRQATSDSVKSPSAVVSPYELVYALADHAAKNGVEFAFGEEVKDNGAKFDYRSDFADGDKESTRKPV